MRPSEALPQDWGLYYNHSFMLHESMGPVFIETGAEEIYASKLTRGSERQLVRPEDLSVWFPLTGSFNVRNTACYVARKAARQMRKSTTIGDLYYVKKGEPLGAKSLANILKDENREYTSFTDSLYLIKYKKYLGRAISRDIMLLLNSNILDSSSNKLRVYFKGERIGEVVGSRVLLYVDPSPLRAFLTRKFMREDILCVSPTQ